MPNRSETSEPSPAVTRSSGLIAKSWRGEETLNTAFYRNIWGAGLCWRLAVLSAESAYSPSEPHGIAIELVVIALYILAVPLFIWGIVSLWRSASKHEQRGGSPFSAVAAKALVVLLILAAIGQIGEAISK
jgi:hypothetical protein